MRKLLLFLMLIASFPSISQNSSGITWDRYYITGSLAVGQATKNTWAQDALLLQIGKDTNNKGYRIPWVVDTANVVFPRPFGTEVGQLKDTTKYMWVGTRWISGKATTSNTDTASLSNRINQRVKYGDTANMLLPFAQKTALKDTASALRLLIGTGSGNIVKYSDTTSMLAPYATKANLKDTSTVLRVLISGSVMDTASLSSRINQRVKYSDTGIMLAPYLMSITAAATYAPASTAATLTGTQTLTNKTLTAPALSGPSITGVSSGSTNDSVLVADPSTGNVKRISSSRLSGTKSVANVRDFGAVGNGITNDRSAFKAAIATGLDVYVPASVDGYALDSTITLKSGQSIFGDGANSKIIFQNPYASGYYMLRTVGFNSIENLQFFVGLKPTWIGDNPALWTTGGVIVTGFANTIHNCWFKTISGAAIHVTGQNTNVTGCYVDDNVCGVLVSSEYNHVSNIIGANNRRAVYITTGNNTMAGCNFIGGGGLFYNNISNGDHSSVIGCTFNHCSDPNLESKNTGSGLNIIGCNFWDGQIKITESNGLNITDCTIGTSMSFSVSGTNTNCVIQNNFIVNTVSLPSDAGIRLLNNFGGASNKYPRSIDQSTDVATGTGGAKYTPVVIDGTTYYIKLETSVP